MQPRILCKDQAGFEYCADPKFDSKHCGGCGNACAANSYCNAGQCTPFPDGGMGPVCNEPMIMCKDGAGRDVCVDPSGG